MAIDPASAAAAYKANAVDLPAGFKPGQIGDGGGAEGPSSSFSELVKNQVGGLVEANLKAENLAIEAAAGNASVGEVVTAIAEAENTLQTVVAVRDRVISAYQEIMRMPI